jgi:hypothetical protein
MEIPLMIGLVLGGFALIALAIYANRPRVRHAQQATAQSGTDAGYTPMVFGDSSSSADADCGSGSDGGAGCGGDGGGGGGGGD